MKNNRGLGKGLSALFAETEEDYGKSLLFDEPETEDKGKEGVQEVDLSSIYPNPDQPRKNFDPDALDELAQSIRHHGVIMPLIVNKEAKGYMIIAGERRYRASKLAGIKKVPVIVKNYTARQIKEISLIENLQREDLNPIEEATAMRALMEDYGMTQDELADRIGKSRPSITNTLRLLQLSPEVIRLVETGALSSGHARAIITVPAEEQIKMANRFVKDGCSVREAEQQVKNFFNPPKEKEKKKSELSLELKELILTMQRVLGTKVNAIGNDNKGRIYIDYYTRDDLDRLAAIIEHAEKSDIQF